MENQTYLNRFMLPVELLAEVAAASPKAAPVVGVDAREMVRVLAQHTETVKALTGQDAEPYWLASLKELVKEYSALTGAQDVTPARVGRLLGGMGLQNHRTGNGYWVLWNKRQLDLLKKHFGV